MDVRLATIADIETIAALNVEVQNLHAEAHPHIFKSVMDGAFAIDYISEQMRMLNHYFYVVNLEGEDVGYVFGRVVRRPESAYMYAWNMIYIDQIAVKSTARGKGCGTRLIQAVRELAMEQGIETVALDTWNFNEGAQAFFAKQGFTTFNLRMWMQVECAS
jgi:ribosomal protein S18 acetylase RimI-like enzyme